MGWLTNSPDAGQTNGDEKWKYRVTTMLDTFLTHFFKNGVIFEIDCETRQPPCTTDMLSFKGYCLRWLAVVTQLAPFTRDAIRPVLDASARAAVQQCTGGPTGRRCGFYWTGGGQFVDPKVDNTTGAGEAMDVLAAVSSLLVDEARAPVRADQGTSKGDPNAGLPGAAAAAERTRHLKRITAADQFGASVVTFLYVMGPMLLFVWICIEEAPAAELKEKDIEVQEVSSSQAL